jgi:hypothetical protein
MASLKAVMLLNGRDVVNLVSRSKTLDNRASARVIYLRNLDVRVALWSTSNASSCELGTGDQGMALVSLIDETARDWLIVIVVNTSSCLDSTIIHVELVLAACSAPRS